MKQIARFLKQVLISALSMVVAGLMLGIILATICWQFSSMRSSKMRHLAKDNAVLTLHMKGKVVECLPVSLLSSSSSKVNLHRLKRTIYQAATDNCIKAIYLKVSHFQIGWGALAELRKALLDFKKQGKMIVAYGDFFSQKAYYLASLADEIVLNPMGCLGFKGLSATTYFYTNLLEKLSIQPVIFRIGGYKSAIEPFCLHKMSEESKAQTKAYLSFLYNHILGNIGEARTIKVADLKNFADELAAILPDDALRCKMITKIGHESMARGLVHEKMAATGNAAPTFVKYKQYEAAYENGKRSENRNKIAVVIAEGEIIDGRTSSGYIGAVSFVKMMHKIKEDDAIKALVLRINSPGGSVLASEIMWQAIEEVKAIKPVVASMSDLAASGGYYIAAPCHYIFAQPTTITGSIGIFGLFFDTAKLMDTIGIERDVVKTAPAADFLEPRTTCTPKEATFFCRMLQKSYDTFLCKVAEGRSLTLKKVAGLAAGRIYDGATAQQNGLVDALGGLEMAIEKAAALANLEKIDYGICYFPHFKTKLELLMHISHAGIKNEIQGFFSSEYPILAHVKHGSMQPGLQAMLPYRLDID